MDSNEKFVNKLDNSLNSDLGFANSQHLIRGGWRKRTRTAYGKNKTKKKLIKRKKYTKKSYKKLLKKNKFKNHYKYTRKINLGKLNKAFFK